MKKNKTIAYILAATLLVGGTFVGTKALFTDSAEATNDLVVTMGNLQLEVKEDNWAVSSNSNEYEQNENAKNIVNNLKPGDSISKDIHIKNSGSLNRKLSVTQKQAVVLPEGITMDDSELQALNGVVLRSGDVSDTVTLTFKIDKNVGGKYGEKGSQNQENKPSWNFGELVGTYEITATQTNEPAPTSRN